MARAPLSLRRSAPECSGACLPTLPSLGFGSFHGGSGSTDTCQMFAVHQDLCLGTVLTCFPCCCTGKGLIITAATDAFLEMGCVRHCLHVLCFQTQWSCCANIVLDSGQQGPISPFLVLVAAVCLWDLEGHPLKDYTITSLLRECLLTFWVFVCFSSGLKHHCPRLLPFLL